MVRTPIIAFVTLAVAGDLVAPGGVVAAATAKTAAPTTTAPRLCTTRGARWTWGRQQGNRYRVYPTATTCSFAKQWSARLSYKRPVLSGGLRVIEGGPTRWTCAMRFPVPFPRAWAGTCSQRSRSFAWLPLLPPSASAP